MAAAALRLGLTGGIGSGKSTVAGLLGQLGAAIIDADAISRSVTSAGGQAIESIAKEFGREFINPSGAVDRDRMRALVYADDKARRRLEAIVHPLVAQQISQQSEAAIQSGCGCLVFDVPLLVESGHWRQKVDRVLVVDCTPAVQIERVMARNGLTREAVEKIIASQAPRDVRLRAADAVVCNDRLDLSQLALSVKQLGRWFGLSFR
jgi:dephospho-CoA kinase